MLLRADAPLSDYLVKYEYLAGLTRRGWAYEHLRRNNTYRRIAYAHQEDIVSVTHWKHNVYALDQLIAQPEAEDWGLIFFPNPDQTALNADIFWCEDVFPNHIIVQVSPRSSGEVDEIYQSALTLRKVRQFNDLKGREHLLLQGTGCAIQILVTGLSLRSADPVKMSFQLSGPSKMEAEFKRIKKVGRVFLSRDLNTPAWTPARQRLRDGIILLDVIEAGLNLQHAARMIYGDKRVDEEWFNGQRAMKDRLRLRLERATAIRDGGYRTFFQKQK